MDETSCSQLCTSSAYNSQRINITIRTLDHRGYSKEGSLFTVKPSSTFCAIFRIYAVRESPYPNCFGYFKFMFCDRTLSGEDTPTDVGIGDGECIDAIACLEDHDDIGACRLV